MKGGAGIVASERNTFSWYFIDSLLNLKAYMGDALDILHVQVGNIHEARNLVLKIAKERNYDWVVMIDSDMTFPSVGVLNLLDTMKRFDAHIGAGLYFFGSPPYSPIAYRFEDDKYTPIKDLRKPCLIDSCGMGFTVITKELFNLSFDPIGDKGEDFSFCVRAQTRGAKIVLDPTVKCGHLRTIPLNEDIINKLI